MKESWLSTWHGTIEELREWLNQFDDNDTIVFSGGSDDGYEFLHVYVNDELVINC